MPAGKTACQACNERKVKCVFARGAARCESCQKRHIQCAIQNPRDVSSTLAQIEKLLDRLMQHPKHCLFSTNVSEIRRNLDTIESSVYQSHSTPSANSSPMPSSNVTIPVHVPSDFQGALNTDSKAEQCQSAEPWLLGMIRTHPNGSTTSQPQPQLTSDDMFWDVDISDEAWLNFDLDTAQELTEKRGSAIGGLQMYASGKQDAPSVEGDLVFGEQNVAWEIERMEEPRNGCVGDHGVMSRSHVVRKDNTAGYVDMREESGILTPCLQRPTRKRKRVGTDLEHESV